MTTIGWFIIVLGALVFVHELGHFIVAKYWRITVEEFGIGFPPRLAKIAEIGGTKYTINALPLGGFVRMAGEEDPEIPGSFASKRRLARATTLVAGPAMNVVLAIVLYIAISMIGAPTPMPDRPGVGVYDVQAGSPAEAAGLRPGDTILRIDDLTLGPNAADQLQAYVASHAGQPTIIIVERGEKMLDPFTIVPRVNPSENRGALGIRVGPALVKKTYPLRDAIVYGFQETGRLGVLMLSTLGDIIRGAEPLEIAGPLGIAQATGEVARSGLVWLMDFTALLSLNLALINLLPFPALDGGRLMFVILEALRGGRRIDPRKERFVHVIGMALLLSLLVFISYFDLMRIVSGQPILGQ
ncbi:MAG: RIP metalloprotease RseP [Anaerolineae bacterium]